MLQQTRLVQDDDCDYGIEVLPSVNRTLDLYLDDEGNLHPAVTLAHAGVERLFVFTDSLSAEELGESGFGRWQKDAQVTFRQMDPTSPDVLIVVLFNGLVLELHEVTRHLRPFMIFAFEDGCNDEPQDDGEDDTVFAYA